MMYVVDALSYDDVQTMQEILIRAENPEKSQEEKKEEQIPGQMDIYDVEKEKKEGQEGQDAAAGQEETAEVAQESQEGGGNGK